MGNTYIKTLPHHRLVLLVMWTLLCFCGSVQVNAATKYLYVGETYSVETPSPVSSDGYIDNAAILASDGHLSVDVSNPMNVKITVIGYFDYTATVKIRFVEKYTYNGHIDKVDHDVSVSIIAKYPTIKQGENTITIAVGETKKLEYTVTPDGLLPPPMNWGYLDYYGYSADYITLSDDGYVTGKKKGRAVVVAVPFNIQKMAFAYIITVVDGKQDKLQLSASPSGGEVSKGTVVKLTTSNASGADIYYTLNGDTPTKRSNSYSSSGITINSSCTLKAIAYKSGYEDSDVLTANYIIKEDTKPKLVLAVSPSSGQVSAGTAVTLTAKANGSSVSGCDIYYTLDGSTPTKNSYYYSSGIIINSDCTLKAIAYKSGYEDSDVLEATYTTPKNKLVLTASPSGGLYIEAPIITLTAKFNGSTMSDASIYYTTNGTMPSTSSTKYKSSGIAICNSCTLRAIAYKDGYTASDVLSESYTIIDTKGIQVIAGSEHSLILKQDGTLWTCGHNDVGQVGDGTFVNRKTFVKIIENVDTAAIDSYGGGYTYALKKDGSLWSWGGDDDERQNSSKPIQVLDDVSSFSIKDDSKYAVKKDGSLWMWGGQIHDADRENVVSLYTIYSPQKVMDKVYKVFAGNSYYMHILKTDGSLWGYGENNSGELGDGTKKTKLTPVKIMSDVSSVIPGYAHTFAIKYDQSLWGWGFNPYGALGDGSKENRLSPVKICDNVKNVISQSHSTFIIKNDNSLWVCGENDFGQLGDGTKNEIYYPEIHYPRKIMDGVKTVSCNGSSSFILKTDGTLWGCGNDWCKMFVGEHLTPVKVAEDVILVSSQYSYVLYVKSDGSVWACGDNSWGRLGIGSNIVWCTSPEKVMDGLFKDSKIEISLSASGYATFFSSESAYKLPGGLSASVVTGIANNKLAYSTFSDNVVPKGVPVMIESDTKQTATYTLTATESTTTYAGTNLLRGSDDATMTTGDGYHYKLSYGPSGTKLDDVFGWYWGAANGGAFQIEGHKAWLVVPKSGNAKTRAFTIEGDEATGIETPNVANENEDDGYYDLQGRRIEKPISRGIYIHNGKKIIIK